jgi:glycosyltransferase involved in cell wall biosynthesis
VKPLLVSTFDNFGGAARAAYRIHHGLRMLGVDSHMLVQEKHTDDWTVTGPDTKWAYLMGRLRANVDTLPLIPYRFRKKTLFSPAQVPFSCVVRKINELDVDLVNLHWICDGMFRVEDLASIRKPVIWTLQDMWPLTGGCHYDEGCVRWHTSNCGICPGLGSIKDRDISRRIFSAKQKTYSKIPKLAIIGLSRWMVDCAKQSPLFAGKDVHLIYNPVDTEQFAPVDQLQARKLLGLPIDKKLILFGAVAATSDPRKGYQLLKEALLQLKNTNELELVVFGVSRPANDLDFKFVTHYRGFLHDDISLRLLYSAADVMVVPSTQESFGLTAAEAMACGTPVVAFDTTGLKDIIDHMVNGYLACPFEPTSLARGIEWILSANQDSFLAAQAREKAICCFDSKLIAEQYLKIYSNILL